MHEFHFEEVVEMDERPENVYRKQVEDRTEYVNKRNTDFREEWEALKLTHEVIPDYVPTPISATWNESEELQQYTMEHYDFDSRIEYALQDGFNEEVVENAYAELKEVISLMHNHPDLVPHGDLIGNVFLVDESPVIIDPSGIPEDEEEESKWMEEDIWQLEWLKNKGIEEF